eukprot:28990-Pyramimonas_sp.AAC.1
MEDLTRIRDLAELVRKPAEPLVQDTERLAVGASKKRGSFGNVQGVSLSRFVRDAIGAISQIEDGKFAMFAVYHALKFAGISSLGLCGL